MINFLKSLFRRKPAPAPQPVVVPIPAGVINEAPKAPRSDRVAARIERLRVKLAELRTLARPEDADRVEELEAELFHYLSRERLLAAKSARVK